jgi:hypothetical protein
MKHEDVYKQFSKQFPEIAIHVEDWFPNGKDSVRVRIKSGSDFVFTYHNFYDWCYETLESYIKKMKGGHKMNVGLHDSINEDE